MGIKNYLSLSEVSELLGKSKETLRRWDNQGMLVAERDPVSNYRIYKKSQVASLFPHLFLDDDVDENVTNLNPNFAVPLKRYSLIELFAGAGGLALGLEKAGLDCVALNELDPFACNTLRENRPEWNVLEGDVKDFDFTQYEGLVDVVTGGFPCQAFSYAGKRLGLEDARGTLFYEFARVVNEVRPLICVGENVKGLLSHDNGRTIQGMISVLNDIGYKVVPIQVLKAINYKVPQKRERLFLVGVRGDVSTQFHYPRKIDVLYTLRDALKAGRLYDVDVPISEGAKYPKRKKEVLEMVPPMGYWKDLPVDIQKEYMGKSYYLGGGKTGMARRIGWNEPCLTLTCSPAQKQTERCHPDETRPFTVREYARIQTFPDDWTFSGPMAQQYKQIGNAIPVNLAKEVGFSIVAFLNDYYSRK